MFFGVALVHLAGRSKGVRAPTECEGTNTGSDDNIMLNLYCVHGYRGHEYDKLVILGRVRMQPATALVSHRYKYSIFSVHLHWTSPLHGKLGWFA
jgi:hypothetical protein